MKSYQAHQSALLEKIKTQALSEITKAIEAAYFATPRHLFIDKLLDYNEAKEIVEITVTEENLAHYLPALYANQPVALAKNSQNVVISSISQPSLVLMMLKKIDLKKGQKVLEIGTASGWNAAMMSKLVGENGAVHTIEIISDLAIRAKAKLEKFKCLNVHTYDGDGAINNYAPTFDRIMFTVGAYDIPKVIHEKLKEEGLLLIVLKTRGLMDSTILLQKKEGVLESISLDGSRFVPLKGDYSMPQLDAVKLETLPIWEKVKDKMIQKQNFWWGNKSTNPRTKMVKLVGITTFLGITEPQFYLFKKADEEISFGLIDRDNEAIVVWANNQLTGYGNDAAFNKIKAAFQLFLDLGMPSANCFQLKVYPIAQKVEVGDNQWLVRRKDSQFLWSL